MGHRQGGASRLVSMAGVWLTRTRPFRSRPCRYQKRRKGKRKEDERNDHDLHTRAPQLPDVMAHDQGTSTQHLQPTVGFDILSANLLRMREA